MTDETLPMCPQCGENRLRRVRNARRRLSCNGCRWQGPDPRTSLQTTDAPAYETTAIIPRPIYAEYPGSDPT